MQYNEEAFLDELYRILLGYQTIEGYRLDYPQRPSREELIERIAQADNNEIELRARMARGYTNYVQWERALGSKSNDPIRLEVGAMVDWVDGIFWAQIGRETGSVNGMGLADWWGSA